MEKKINDTLLNISITYDDNDLTSNLLPLFMKNIPDEKIFVSQENAFPIPFNDIMQLEKSKQLVKFKSYYISLCYGIQGLACLD